jgi:hypothetical protein
MPMKTMDVIHGRQQRGIVMGFVNASELKPGMVVRGEVSNKHGNVLLKKGDSLTEKNIVLLKSWGITEIDIVTVDNQQSESEDNAILSPEKVESIEKEVREMFPEFQDNPLMEKLYGIVKKNKINAAIEHNLETDNETGTN